MGEQLVINATINTPRGPIHLQLGRGAYLCKHCSIRNGLDVFFTNGAFLLAHLTDHGNVGEVLPQHVIDWVRETIQREEGIRIVHHNPGLDFLRQAITPEEQSQPGDDLVNWK